MAFQLKLSSCVSWPEAAIVVGEELELDTALQPGGACDRCSISFGTSASDAIFSLTAPRDGIGTAVSSDDRAQPSRSMSPCSACWSGRSNLVQNCENEEVFS